MKVTVVTTYAVDRREFERAASEFYGRQWRMYTIKMRGESETLMVGTGGVIWPNPQEMLDYVNFAAGYIARMPTWQITLVQMAHVGVINPGIYQIEL